MSETTERHRPTQLGLLAAANSSLAFFPLPLQSYQVITEAAQLQCPACDATYSADVAKAGEKCPLCNLRTLNRVRTS